MPMPAAPPAPARETPPEPQKPAPTPKLEQQKQQLPEVPKIVDAVNPVTLPPKQQQATPPRQPNAPPPAAPTQQIAAAAAAPVRGQPAQGAPTAQQNWEGLVLARLERKKRYPGEAMNAGQEDVVYLHIVIDRSGHVLQSEVVKSKHFRLLDDATRDLIKRAAPLPPLPASMTGDTYAFTVPIDFFIARPRK